MGGRLMGEACPAAGDDCTDGECHGRILVGEHLAACRACARGQELMGTVVWRPQQQPTEVGTMGKKKKKCTHPQCTNPGKRDVVAKGLCGSCYARYRRGELDLEAGTGGAPETPETPEAENTPEPVQTCPADCPPAHDPHAAINFPNSAAGRELLEHNGRLLVAESATPEPGEPSDRPDDPDLPDDGYAPGVTAVLETLPGEGQLVGDEDPAPGACQGWPETAGTSSQTPVPEAPDVAPSFEVAGLRFEAVDLGLIRAVTPEVRIKKNGVTFVAEAVRRFGLDRYRAFRVFRAPGALGLEFLAEGAADALAVTRQTKSAVNMCSGSNAMGRLFPELVGRALPLTATEREGFFLARLPEEGKVAA